jgi:hypothetical protein
MNLFSGILYDTRHLPRALGDRLFLNARWYLREGTWEVVNRSIALRLRDRKAWAEPLWVFRLMKNAAGVFI